MFTSFEAIHMLHVHCIMSVCLYSHCPMVSLFPSYKVSLFSLSLPLSLIFLFFPSINGWMDEWMDGPPPPSPVSPSSTMTTKAAASLQKLPSFVYHFPSFSDPSLNLPYIPTCSTPFPFVHGQGFSPIRKASFNILSFPLILTEPPRSSLIWSCNMFTGR